MGHTETDIREAIIELRHGLATAESISRALDLETPHPSMIKRLMEIVKDEKKCESAIKVSLLKAGE